MKLKPFTDKATCPKCQTEWPTKGTSPRYCNGNDCPLPLITTKTTTKDGWDVTTTDAPHLPEHLHCACFNCGYGWLMECADAEPSPGPEKDKPPDPSHEIVCPTCDEVLLLHCARPGEQLLLPQLYTSSSGPVRGAGRMKPAVIGRRPDWDGPLP